MTQLLNEDKMEDTATDPRKLQRQNSKKQYIEQERLYGTNFPSIIDIKKAIPKHCFESSLMTSMYYVLKDISIVLCLYCSIVWTDNQKSLFYLSMIWTPCYWLLQGTMLWAVFVLGHDCGHGSFSNYGLLNDIIGNFLHAAILVPYYPWKLSHKHHHKNTGNIDKDEIFYPVREKDFGKDLKIISPLFGFGVSWFAYLVKGYLPRGSCHLNPLGSLCKSNFLWCSISIASVLFQIFLSFQYMLTNGVYSLFSHYVMPVMVFASWLVLVTFLHHNDVNVPWYGDKTWGNVKGQLSSVDRHYGWAHHLTHCIGTHQIHHLFIKIPHYHLEEATKYFRKAFPEHIRISNQPILPAYVKMFNIFNSQRHISNDVDIHLYQDLG